MAAPSAEAEFCTLRRMAFSMPRTRNSLACFFAYRQKRRAETGFYGLANIFNADFQAQLVVLSGCETALGEQVDGEGLIGVTWGFLYAGARMVVSSLWKVDEEATAELMATFYEGMIQNRMPPARVRHAAQILIS
jgi:CHAT domain-containing protein